MIGRNSPVPRQRAQGNIATPTQLFSLLEQIFQRYVSNSSDSELSNVKFFKEYPQGTDPSELELPCITYKLKSKEPSEHERKKRYRDEFEDQNNPGHKIIIYGKVYDCELGFDVWARDNKEAENITEDFEAFIERYLGVIKERGVLEIYFNEYTYQEDEDWDDYVSHRELVYNTQLERLFIISTKELEEVDIQVEVPGVEDLGSKIEEILEEKYNK